MGLVLTRSLESSEVTVMHGKWDGVSDHEPVGCTLDAIAQPKLIVPAIPQKQRENQAYTEAAKSLYKRKLPNVVEPIKTCRITANLENIYSMFKNTVLAPWERARKHRPRHWNDYLEYLKRERSKKYRRARATASPADWNQYSKLDKRIRRTVRCAKERFAKTTANCMASSNPRDAQKRIKSIVRKSHTDAGSSNASDDSVLDPIEFTRHLATLAGAGCHPDIVAIPETLELRSRVAQAIRRAPRRKASGIDELFSEAFKLAPTEFSKVIVSFWVKCSQLQHLLDDWSTAVVVPPYKKGRKSIPANYRPNSLLSHARQMISRAVGATIRKEYKFHGAQLGFQEHTRTETAIVRHGDNLNAKLCYAAVLDLKDAYGSVPRDLLMQRVRACLSKRTADQIALQLQPMAICTKYDPSGTMATITRGVPQGCSSSLDLYNLYMDTFPASVEESLQFLQTIDPAVDGDVGLFADVVKPQSSSAEGLQVLLDSSTAWASKQRMTWSIQKCDVLEPQDSMPAGLYELAGSHI